MKLKIKKFNEPVLRLKAEPVKQVTPEIKEIVLNMSQLMKEEKGIGLAGPQVGIGKRIIVVQLDLRKMKVVGLINPKIIRKSPETEIQEEGCLSFPNIFLEIERSREVDVKALDIDGKEIIIKAKGLAARVLQHEIDHLDGVPFFNRLPFFKRIGFKLKHPGIKL
tara:strand:+ start:170 stop:664 length:495 start_codon:yes stop_codon:yes gene_type:complete